MKLVLLLSAYILFDCLLYVAARPIFDDDDFDFSIPDIGVDCNKLGCPSGATACSRKTSTSKNRQEITEEIKCFNANGATTRDETTSKPNPNPGSIQSGYEFYGSYSGGTSIHTSDDGQNVNNNVNVDNVETFTK